MRRVSAFPGTWHLLGPRAFLAGTLLPSHWLWWLTRRFCSPGRRMASGRPVRSWCAWAWTRHMRTAWPLIGSARSCPHAQPACALPHWRPCCGASRRIRAWTGCARLLGSTAPSTRSTPSESARGASERPDPTGTLRCIMGLVEMDHGVEGLCGMKAPCWASGSWKCVLGMGAGFPQSFPGF